MNGGLDSLIKRTVSWGSSKRRRTNDKVSPQQESNVPDNENQSDSQDHGSSEQPTLDLLASSSIQKEENSYGKRQR